MKSDYEELQKNHTKLQADLELLKQELHDCKRQIKHSQTIEAEYQEEIRILQTQGTIKEQKLEARVQQLEETNAKQKAAYNEIISNLEKEVVNKEEEISLLKKEIEEVTRISQNQEPVVDNKHIDEISHLKLLNQDLVEHVSELEKSLQVSEQKKLTLQDIVKQLGDELESYKETLKCKREEIEEANTLIQTLKDDYICVKSELDLVKSKPLDDKTRGNSLFAEVDDRRLQLQQNMKIMKSQYIEMKRERASLLKQVTTLRHENATLIAQRTAEINAVQFDEETIGKSYKYQIQTLNDLIESYQKELKEKIYLEGGSPDGLKFFNSMIAAKNEEIQDLRNKLSQRSLNHTTLAYDLAQANRKITKCDLENLQLKNEMAQMKLLHEEVAPVEQPTLMEAKPKSIIKQSENIIEDTDKENESVADKRVQFSESTVESHITNRRKGGKTLTCIPRKY